VDVFRRQENHLSNEGAAR